MCGDLSLDPQNSWRWGVRVATRILTPAGMGVKTAMPWDLLGPV